MAAGPLASTLAGAGFGALGGGLIGAIKDLGVPDEDAHFYAEGVRRGGTMVSVRADDTLADDIADVLNRHGAIDVDERHTEFRTAGFSQFSHDTEPYNNYDADLARRSRNTTGATATMSDTVAGSATGSSVGVGTQTGATSAGVMGDTGTTASSNLGTSAGGGMMGTGSSLGAGMTGTTGSSGRNPNRARVYTR